MAQGILADQGVELVKLVCSLGTSRPSDAETLRQRCEHLLREFVERCQRAGAGAEAITAAKYALVALIDERILRSDLPVAQAWLADPLQMRHFDSFAAGEEFYTRLERYRHPQGAAEADVLEVYHLCLCLGFAGKHGDDAGRERRRLLVEHLTGEILGARGGATADLSPSWRPSGSLPAPAEHGRWHGLPVWIVPLAAAVIVFLAAVAMDAVVDSRLESFIRDFPAR